MRSWINTAKSDARYQEAVADERRRLREEEENPPEGSLWKGLRRWANKSAAVAVTPEQGFGQVVRLSEPEESLVTMQLETELKLRYEACRLLVARVIPEDHPQRHAGGIECDIAAEFKTPTEEMPEGHCCARRTLDGAWVEMPET